MKRFLKTLSWLGILSFFCTVDGMHKTQHAPQIQEYSGRSQVMVPVTMRGSFVMIPIVNAPTLYLISAESIISYTVPQSIKMSTTAISSLLGSSGFTEVYADPVSLQSSSQQLDRDTMMSIPKILPAGISSAIEFLIKRKTNIPEDESSLFFLKSLLLLDKADKGLIEKIDDELSGYESYYRPDPYNESLKHVHEIGIHEYVKLFTETGFNDIQLILEFSKIARFHNTDCNRDFDTILNSLKMITEIVVENETNVPLLEKFKSLYERIILE